MRYIYTPVIGRLYIIKRVCRAGLANNTIDLAIDKELLVIVGGSKSLDSSSLAIIVVN